MIFCDTSAVAKLYVQEPESAAVKQLLEAQDEVCVSVLLRAELMAAFQRRLREKKWTRADFHAAVRQFSHDDLGGFWTWLPMDSVILEAAAKCYVPLPPSAFLCTADCLHLMTALQHNFSAIYTNDRQQSAAAAVLGIKAVVA